MIPIVAIASPIGSGAIGIIRVSGHGAHQIVAQHLRSVIHKLSYRHAYYKKFYSNEEYLDDLIAVFYKGPCSYTGEDMVELSTHASPYIMQQVLSALCRSGAQQAQAGEFTRRAFIHGKLDLNQAEGIAQTIAVESKQQLIAARQLTSGRYSRHIADLRKDLIQALAYLEARIDFPDEGETSAVEMQQARSRLLAVQEQIHVLVKSYENGKVARNGLKVLLLGLPNSGKSTLLNYFLDCDRAIVSDVAGTTRDFIEESCLLDGRLVRFIDTAGIRDSNDPIEKEGIKRSLQWIDQSDLVLYLVSLDRSLAEKKADEIFLASIRTKNKLVVCTKADLAEQESLCHKSREGSDIFISSYDPRSLELLKDKICQLVDRKIEHVQDQVSVSSKRHHNILQQSYDDLVGLLQEESTHYDECLAYDIQQIVKNLDEIVGTVDHEDVLDHIFTQFCIGK